MTEPGVLWHHAYLLTSMTVFSVVIDWTLMEAVLSLLLLREYGAQTCMTREGGL